ncbi:MAG: pantoate--beta-alanine ligase [Magnetococcales bacterium]|nr:pantoate--beta-alanine ligase [Magnetococcales bacterium]
MKVIKDRETLDGWLEECNRQGDEVGFIPTMGALHAGHLSLVAEAQKSCSKTIVSIFVNPTQFGPGEDFAQYPRTFTEDRAKLEEVGCDAVFLPSTETVYPPGGQTFIRVEPLASQLCGASRPGHFQGVATVVSILLNLVRPRRAYFGVKDYQQFTLIKQMVRDLAMAVEVVGVAIVREQDGLALSSRNSYLTAVEREQATALYRALTAAKTLYQDGESDSKILEDSARQVLLAAGIEKIDYVEVRHSETLVKEWSGQTPVMLIAAKVGKTRLIDNMLLNQETAINEGNG